MLVEDPEALRGRMMKKEKLVKDVVSFDARQGYQFLSGIKKELEKEKDVLSVKLSFVYKIAQIFYPGAPVSKLEDLLLMGGILRSTVENQTALLSELAAANRKPAGSGAEGTVDVKTAIKEYMLAKELMKKRIAGFVLQHRGAIIKTRAEAAVEYMKKTGELPKDATEERVAQMVRAKEGEILLDVVLPELAKKTYRMETAVNRLVAWRSRMASQPAEAWNQPGVISEKTSLLQEFMQAVEEVKKQALEGVAGAGVGIFNAPDALGIIGGFKTNLNEQKMRTSHLIEFVNGLHTQPAGDRPPMHEIEGSSVAQAAADKLVDLMKEERNMYVDLRKWEPVPGQFFSDMAGAVKFPSESNGK